ncbi:hypothetical protein Agub_g2746, partial [Astrephomene gubernaculifera]
GGGGSGSPGAAAAAAAAGSVAAAPAPIAGVAVAAPAPAGAGVPPAPSPALLLPAVEQLRALDPEAAAVVAGELPRLTGQLRGANEPTLWAFAAGGGAACYAVAYCRDGAGYGDPYSPARVLFVPPAAPSAADALGNVGGSGGGGGGAGQVQRRRRAVSMSPRKWYHTHGGEGARLGPWQGAVEVALLPSQLTPSYLKARVASGLRWVRYPDWWAAYATPGGEDPAAAAATAAAAAAQPAPARRAPLVATDAGGGGGSGGGGGAVRPAAPVPAPVAAAGAASGSGGSGSSAASASAAASSLLPPSVQAALRVLLENPTGREARQLAARPAAAAAGGGGGEGGGGGSRKAPDTDPVLVRVRCSRTREEFRYGIAYCPPGAKHGDGGRGMETGVRIIYLAQSPPEGAAAAAGPSGSSGGGGGGAAGGAGVALEVLTPTIFCQRAAAGAQGSYSWRMWVQVLQEAAEGEQEKEKEGAGDGSGGGEEGQAQGRSSHWRSYGEWAAELRARRAAATAT